MQFKNLALMVAALPAAFAFPSYKIPIALSRVLSANSADTACTYPEGFEIQNFQTLTPTGGNGSTVDIHFGFFDESTNIQTTCQRNATSKNVAKPDLAARWACDNSLVEFIWQSPKLTLVEVACPGTTGCVSLYNVLGVILLEETNNNEIAPTVGKLRVRPCRISLALLHLATRRAMCPSVRRLLLVSSATSPAFSPLRLESQSRLKDRTAVFYLLRDTGMDGQDLGETDGAQQRREGNVSMPEGGRDL
jgi:hypothetical protein